MTLLRIIAMVLALALAALPARAHHQGQSQPAVTQGSDVTDIIFDKMERRIIDDYFGKKAVRDDDHGKGKKKKKAKGKGKSKKFPPGLAKRRHLPPGLAKKHKLPPGLAKREIPQDLADRLGIPPEGTERVIVDSNVLLVETATGVVLDILNDVITGRK